eukprot:c20573_g3_i5.p1 GENE.c20573_g3_i5~~c20573_g3_i5.p1  ORF type:complete len:537 (+),score=100.34 c20573_g3_i5:2-1612(+)
MGGLRMSAVNCNACNQEMNETSLYPLVLSCGHTLCIECVETFTNSSKVSCPLDSVVTQGGKFALPRLAATALAPPNMAILKAMLSPSDPPLTSAQLCEPCDQQHAASHLCQDCSEFMCETIAKAHSKAKATRGHTVVAVERGDTGETLNGDLCPDHQQPFVAYDTQCKKLVCGRCGTLGAHTGHPFCEIEDVLQRFQKDLAKLLGQGEEIVERFQRIDQHISRTASSIVRCADESKAAIRDAFKQIRECVDERERQLLQQVEQMSKAQQFDLHDQQKCVSNSLACVRYSVEVGRGAGKSTGAEAVKALSELEGQGDGAPAVEFKLVAGDISELCKIIGSFAQVTAPSPVIAQAQKPLSAGQELCTTDQIAFDLVSDLVVETRANFVRFTADGRCGCSTQLPNSGVFEVSVEVDAQPPECCNGFFGFFASENPLNNHNLPKYDNESFFNFCVYLASKGEGVRLGRSTLIDRPENSPHAVQRYVINKNTGTLTWYYGSTCQGDYTHALLKSPLYLCAGRECCGVYSFRFQITVISCRE